MNDLHIVFIGLLLWTLTACVVTAAFIVRRRWVRLQSAPKNPAARSVD